MINYFSNPLIDIALRFFLSGGMTRPAYAAELPFIVDPDAQANYVEENLGNLPAKYDHNRILRVVENVFDFSHPELVLVEDTSKHDLEAEIEFKNAALACIRLAGKNPKLFDKIDEASQTAGFRRIHAHHNMDFDTVLANSLKRNKPARGPRPELN